MSNHAKSPIGPPNCFHTHKQAESAKDYQDAYALNSKTGRYAIADGATKSFFSANWAKLLVQYFCNSNDSLNTELFKHENWPEWLQPVQQEWNREIKTIVDNTPAKKYYVRNRYARREPALATFVGLKINITNQTNIRWQAMITGDSCLFHVRGNEVTSYLIRNSQQFDYHPKLLSSVDSYNDKSNATFISGTVREGDFLILATDAIAKWMLTHYENGAWQQVWQTLRQMTSDSFYQIIDQARQNSQTPLENDDVTLMIIPIGEQATKPLRRSSSPPQHTQGQRSGQKAQDQDTLENFFGSIQNPSPSATQAKSLSNLPSQDSAHSAHRVQQNHSHQAQNAQHLLSQQKLETLQTKVEQWRKIALVLSALFVCSACINFVVFFEPFSTPKSQSSEATAPISTQNESGNLVSVTTSTAPASPTLSATVASPLRIYSDTSESQILITITNEITASLTVKSNEWDEIVFDGWVIDEKIQKGANNDQILIRPDSETDTYLRSEPNRDDNQFIIGTLTKGLVHQIISESSEKSENASNTWYQIRIIGFVPKATQ